MTATVPCRPSATDLLDDLRDEARGQCPRTGTGQRGLRGQPWPSRYFPKCGTVKAIRPRSPE
jgi:hypothetical protein